MTHPGQASAGAAPAPEYALRTRDLVKRYGSRPALQGLDLAVPQGVIYGLLGYLLLIGWLEKRPFTLLLSTGCLVVYGGALTGLVPLFTPAGVSWIGHFSGFCGGLLAAWAVHREQGA